jgi:hypothetical protein
MYWVGICILHLFVTSTRYVHAFGCRPQTKELRGLSGSLETASLDSLTKIKY